jgi:hypothetical protein
MVEIFYSAICDFTFENQQNIVFVSVGKAKAKVINESRSAIKQNNVNLLLKVVRNGDSA